MLLLCLQLKEITLGFPYVVVRLGCPHCGRKGRYRLAWLVEQFGAEAALGDVLTALSGDYPRRTALQAVPSVP